MDLYLQRIQDAPLIEYILLLLENSYLLGVIGSKSSGRKFEGNDVTTRRSQRPSVGGGTSSHAESGPYRSLMDNLQRRYISNRTCEPDNETGESSLQRLERRIADWLAAMNVGKKTGGQSKMATGSVQKLRRFKVGVSYSS